MLDKPIEIIRKRGSCRSFARQAINSETTAQLNAYIDEINKESAGLSIRYQLVDRQSEGGKPIEKLGTYGVISGAQTFIAGIVAKSGANAVQFGYWFEKIILCATELGLATCWLGGSFNRADFGRKVMLSEQEFIPIVSPVGYAAEKRSVMENLVRSMAKSSTRLPFPDLFLTQDGPARLSPEAAGQWAVPLEMVQLGPSASNKQPWRVIMNESGFDFCLARTVGYASLGFDMQMNDIGIAMCHFELSARELGLPGSWQKLSRLERPDMIYVMSWVI